jgi:hypothetical protein
LSMAGRIIRNNAAVVFIFPPFCLLPCCCGDLFLF